MDFWRAGCQGSGTDAGSSGFTLSWQKEPWELPSNSDSKGAVGQGVNSIKGAPELGLQTYTVLLCLLHCPFRRAAKLPHPHLEVAVSPPLLFSVRKNKNPHFTVLFLLVSHDNDSDGYHPANGPQCDFDAPCI